MKPKNEAQLLRERIEQLNFQREEAFMNLQRQFHETVTSLSPANLIKNSIQNVASSTEIRQSLLNKVIGLATGYVSKKVVMGSSSNPIKNVIGALFQFGVAQLVSGKLDQKLDKEEE